MAIVYPLKEVLEVKHRRVEQAEKVVAEKKQALQVERDKLAQREAERDKMLQHNNDKLKQMRAAMDGGTTSPEILQMRAYLKVVKEKLKIEEKKVKDQKEQVDLAEKNLTVAEAELRARRTDVDKLKSHRVDWEKEMRRENDIIEGREQDELGSITFSTNKRKQL